VEVLRQWLLCSIALVLLGTGFGCGNNVEPTRTGEVSVKWAVSPYGCKSAGVERVEVVIKGDAQLRQKVADCSKSELVFRAIPLGTYQAEFTGYSEEGNATFSGKIRKLRVEHAGLNRTKAAELTARPASLVIEWNFDNGEVCGFNNVDQIEVAGFDKTSNEVFRTEFDCNLGRGRIADIAADTYVLRAVAESDDGGTFQASKEVVLKKGQKHSVKLSLDQLKQ
jgi:hypothetical protein